MIYKGYTRYIHFRVVDVESVPILGLVLSDFQVFYRHNNVAQPTDGLTLTEVGNGRYCLSYVASALGNDFLELYHGASDIRILDTEDIVTDPFGGGTGGEVDDGETEAFGVVLDHNYGGTDALIIHEDRPEEFKLYIYLSADWDLNKRSDDDAIGITGLDREGRWLSKIRVSPDKYHLVLKKFRTVKIIKPRMQVS
jgi:hypothetical protein